MWLTNLAVVVFVAALCFAFGWQTVLFVELPIVILAGSVGIWLFYVQHQFQPTYWERTDEWSFNDAALRGSSHLALPKVLQFFSGNIGFHHVHHLNPKIPNYNLPASAPWSSRCSSRCRASRSPTPCAPSS